MIRNFSILICMCLFITGCSAEQEILDDIYLTTLVGYDLIDGKTQGTAVVPLFQADGTILNQHFTSEGILSKELGRKTNFQTPNPLANGKVEIAMFGKDFAEKGITETSDIYRRDPSISANLKLAVFNGSTHAFIVNHSVPNQDLGMYITKLIEQNIEEEAIPKTNIHLFFQSYFTEGKDPFLPLLVFKNEKVQLDGLTIFKKGKAAGEISIDDLYLFHLLYSDLHKGKFTVQVPALDSQVSIAHIKTQRKVEIEGDVDAPQITFKLELKGIINEYYGNVTGIEKKIKLIEKQVNKQLESRAESFIKNLQEQNLDPIGIGKSSKAYFRNWEEEKWKEMYPELDIQVKINTTILESGVIR